MINFQDIAQLYLLKSTTLDVGLGLVSDIHKEFSPGTIHVLECAFINAITNMISIKSER